jgi:hypothetical protein
MTATRRALIALLCGISTPASAQLLQRKELSYPIALTIAQAALEDCKARGYATSVVVVDRGGNTVVALRGDNASAHTMENARRKAYTAMTFKMTTDDFIKEMATSAGASRADDAAERDRHRRRCADQGGKRRDRRGRPLRFPRRGRAVRDGGHREGEGSAAMSSGTQHAGRRP